MKKHSSNTTQNGSLPSYSLNSKQQSTSIKNQTLPTISVPPQVSTSVFASHNSSSIPLVTNHFPPDCSSKSAGENALHSSCNDTGNSWSASSSVRVRSSSSSSTNMQKLPRNTATTQVNVVNSSYYNNANHQNSSISTSGPNNNIGQSHILAVNNRSSSSDFNTRLGNESNNNNRLLVNENKHNVSLFANSFSRALDKNMSSIVSLQKECVHILESFHQMKEQLYSFETEMNDRYESIINNIDVTLAPPRDGFSTQSSSNDQSKSYQNVYHTDNNNIRSLNQNIDISNKNYNLSTDPRQGTSASSQPNTTITNSTPCLQIDVHHNQSESRFLQNPQNENYHDIATDGFHRAADAANHQTTTNHQRQSTSNFIDPRLPRITGKQEMLATNRMSNDKKKNHIYHHNQENDQSSHEHMNGSIQHQHEQDKHQPPHQTSSNTRMSAQISLDNEQAEHFSQSTYIFSPHGSSDDPGATSSSDQSSNNSNKGKSTMDFVLSSMNFHPKRKSSQSTPLSSAPVKKKPFLPTQEQQQNKIINQRQPEFVHNLKSLRDQGFDKSDGCEKPTSHVMAIPSTSDEDNGGVLSSNDDPTSSSIVQQHPSTTLLAFQPPQEVKIKEEVLEGGEDNVNFEISAIPKNSNNLWPSSIQTPAATGAYLLIQLGFTPFFQEQPFHDFPGSFYSSSNR